MQWDSDSNQWVKVGTVVDAVGSGRKQLYQGKEWDYVFDVDVNEGAPPLKLPYNASGALQTRINLPYLLSEACFREPLGGRPTILAGQ